MSIGTYIKELRQARGLTLEQVGDLVGVGKSTVRKWENGIISDIKRSNLCKLASALGVGVLDLIEQTEFADVLPAEVKAVSTMPYHKIPLLGSVAAGQPILAEEDWSCPIDGPMKADYALRVQGDSMSPGLLDGDVVYIKAQPQTDYDGQIAVALVDDSATIKHIYTNKNGFTLVSDNPKYAPMIETFADHDYLAILGIVVGFTRMF